MASTSRLIRVSGTHPWDYQDTVTQVYRVEFDFIPTNEYTALAAAQTAAGTPVPLRRAAYSGGPLIYCSNIHGDPESVENNRAVWLFTVTFSVPPPGQQDPDQQNENPLLRPPVYNIQYMERERVIEKARNVEYLEHGDGKGDARDANTLGPVVNAAGIRPDEPIVDTERLEVLVITKNYASLAAIVTRNRTFKGTTNSDDLLGYSARELRYMMTESLGKQFENGIEYWPGVTEVLAQETTDLKLDNVGYEYWDTTGFPGWVRDVDKNGDFLAEPFNLKLDGDKGGSLSTTITYRHLTETAYASLIT